MVLFKETQVDPRPKIACFYGRHKIGKSTIVSQIPDSAIIGFEAGFESLKHSAFFRFDLAFWATMKKKFGDDREKWKQPQLFSVLNLILDLVEKEIKNLGKTFLAVDTTTSMEDFVNDFVAACYNSSRNKENNPEQYYSVADAPHGAGWGLQRTITKKLVERFSKIVPYIIFLGHTKPLKEGDNNGSALGRELFLTGKNKGVFLSLMSAVGYLRYNKVGFNNELFVEFKPANSDMDSGVRTHRLSGKSFQMTETDESKYPELKYLGYHKALWENIYGKELINKCIEKDKNLTKGVKNV